MIRGMIVCSSAGSDKDKFSVITEVDDDFVYISDGKRHKLASPKRKNKKHVAKTSSFIESEKMTTDKALRSALAEYRSKL